LENARQKPARADAESVLHRDRLKADIIGDRRSFDAFFSWAGELLPTADRA